MFCVCSSNRARTPVRLLQTNRPPSNCWAVVVFPQPSLKLSLDALQNEGGNQLRNRPPPSRPAKSAGVFPIRAIDARFGREMHPAREVGLSTLRSPTVGNLSPAKFRVQDAPSSPFEASRRTRQAIEIDHRERGGRERPKRGGRNEPAGVPANHGGQQP